MSTSEKCRSDWILLTTTVGIAATTILSAATASPPHDLRSHQELTNGLPA